MTTNSPPTPDGPTPQTPSSDASRWIRSDKLAISALGFSVVSAGLTLAFSLGGGSANVASLSQQVQELKVWQNTARDAVARMGTANPAELKAQLQTISQVLSDPDTGWDSVRSDIGDLTEGASALSERVRVLRDDVDGHDAVLSQHRKLIEANKEAIRTLEGPIGAIAAWPSTKPAPKGWHLCDGSLIDISGPNDPIYLALGETYATEPVPTLKVKLPDFQGMFLRGAGGRASMIGKRQLDAVGPHTHKVQVTHPSLHGQDKYDGGATWPRIWPTGATHTTEGPQQSGDSSPPAEETRPVNYAVHWIIRVK